MSARVSAILSSGKQVIDTLLSDWEELRYVYDVAKNDTRSLKQGYAFIPYEANTPESQVNGSYTLDQRFEIILTDLIARGKSDKEAQATIASLFDLADDVFKELVATKVGEPTIVLNVFSPSISAPEILEKVDAVVLRMQVLVKYRSLLN